jgi:hypothetical protein
VGDDLPAQRREVERALALARAGGDDRLELEARRHLTLMRIWTGEAGIEECEEIAELALERGEWVAGLRSMNEAATLRLMRGDFDQASVVLRRGGELAEAHGLNELLGWNAYTHVENGLVSGAWDDAVAAAAAAHELAERQAHSRVAVRTWFALVPILGARGELGALRSARDWFAAQGLTSEHAKTISPFAHVMAVGVEAVLARHGLADPPQPDPEICLPHIVDQGGLPSWLSAVEELLCLWIERGEGDFVRRALEERAGVRKGDPRSLLLGHGIDELTAARLDGDEGAAREALRLFRDLRAPWWQSKALCLLGEAEAAEAAAIERGLGIPVVG